MRSSRKPCRETTESGQYVVKPVNHVRSSLGKDAESLKRRACQVLGQPRSTQRRQPHVPGDEPRLLKRILELATKFGRYGYETYHLSLILQPWQLYLVSLAGWINREQQEVIEYLRTENAVLKEKLGKQQVLLLDGKRRRLAVKAKILGRKRLQEFGTLFTLDTILR